MLRARGLSNTFVRGKAEVTPGGTKIYEISNSAVPGSHECGRSRPSRRTRKGCRGCWVPAFPAGSSPCRAAAGGAPAAPLRPPSPPLAPGLCWLPPPETCLKPPAMGCWKAWAAGESRRQKAPGRSKSSPIQVAACMPLSKLS